MTCADPLPGAALLAQLPPSTRPAAFWWRLAEHGAAPALRDGETVVSYAEVAERADRLAARLGTTRRLVLVRARNDLATVVSLLACLRGGHPVLLTDATSPAPALGDAGPPPSRRLVTGQPGRVGAW